MNKPDARPNEGCGNLPDQLVGPVGSGATCSPEIEDGAKVSFLWRRMLIALGSCDFLDGEDKPSLPLRSDIQPGKVVRLEKLSRLPGVKFLAES